ncbi:phosphoribosyltransferase [Staphylococcus xylosus]|uniref:phosphoribosyltransferase n=1 Tax=Staphylococcus xylosus TaxID=1288 RepID=UPI002DB878A6|nr:phosphoribosyltransferase [Staphylococcus xylosus]MEB8175280.1 phosphoribosyltransferase [Staphylococcus xylosus]
MNKLLCISKLLVFNKENMLQSESLKILDELYDNDIQAAIVAKKQSISKMKEQLPSEYKEKVIFFERGSKRIKTTIQEIKKNEKVIICMVGIVDADAIFSFNCKIPLFNIEKLISNPSNISEKVKKYGLPVNKFQDIIDCMKAFDVHKTNYFQMNFGNRFTIMCLNNANYYYKPKEEVRIKEIFQANLKGDVESRDQKVLLLLLFNLISEISTSQNFDEVDYWGTFPSSDPQNTDTATRFIKESIRYIEGGKPNNGPELLIRKQKTQPKHKSGNSRTMYKCKNDFESLIINPQLIDKIEGKVVCIIDDYITNGYSAESAKHLFLKANVKKLIFISIGKFGTDYYSTNYTLDGDITSKYKSSFKNEVLYNKMNNGINFNFENDKSILEYADYL